MREGQGHSQSQPVPARSAMDTPQPKGELVGGLCGTSVKRYLRKGRKCWREGGGGNKVRGVGGAPWQSRHTPKGAAAYRQPCQSKYTPSRNCSLWISPHESRHTSKKGLCLVEEPHHSIGSK